MLVFSVARTDNAWPES